MFPKMLGTVSIHKGGESMPITTNSGGILHNLSPIYARNGAILNELSTIYARNGGVLSTIYEKDSGGGGGGDSGGGEVTPPVDPTRTETFHWGNYTGTANTTPVCIGNFTIDESMNCTYKNIFYFNIENHSEIPTDSMIPSNFNKSKLITYINNYAFYIYIKKSMDVNGYNSIIWGDDRNSFRFKYAEYNRNSKGEWVRGSCNDVPGLQTTKPEPLEKGTYYVYFSNYIECYFHQNFQDDVFVKYMPWDNMSVDVTLTLKPIS